MAYLKCSECGESVTVTPQPSPRTEDEDLYRLLFRRFQRHCIEKRHLLGGADSWLIAFADFRSAATPEPPKSSPDPLD